MNQKIRILLIKESLTYVVEIRNIDKNKILVSDINEKEQTLNTRNLKFIRRIKNEIQETKGMVRQIESMERVCKINEHMLSSMESAEDRNRRFAQGEGIGSINKSIEEKEKHVTGGWELLNSYKCQLARIQEDNKFIAIRNMSLENWKAEKREEVKTGDTPRFKTGIQKSLFEV